MPDAGVSSLTAWESFYVIIGSSAATLTGLMFVVITLIPDARTRLAVSGAGVSTFSTPTVLHFCAALLASAILTSPWGALSQAGLAVGLTGLAGVVYCGVVVRRVWRVQRQTDYKPVLEDWVWHAALPFVAYLTFVVAGMTLQGRPTKALFGIGTATLLLLFIGIHNAWDTVTYMTLERMKSRDEARR